MSHEPAERWDGRAPGVETIATAYLAAAGGDAGLALRRAIADALADLGEAERRTRQRDRLISRGYVRAGPIGRGDWP
ncbi:hypothetical protein [Methylobacterium frigidaeris]|uniref:Uncharacterized protein n=1 Tax=Methylobacterium frigidaeris TaxID=2038277 RepID=A0AA37H8H9_9HYPH|nr:hypothetical protein [Methylobacterium frigidaeris]PIK68904.1 hypothetical protein CS379_32635 [Methylobacterium frigidaeris]GJD60720.1 hypothetical protein MPEAHAMD_0859 [Methylobacterium frigidaeris]